MSGLVSGIATVFKPVVSGISTVLGKAVTGVGATVATAGAAAGGGVVTGAMASTASFGFGAGGLLNSMFSGASKVVGAIGSGLSSAVSPATEAISGAGPGIVGEGLKGGMARGSLLERAGDFLKSEGGAGLVKGIGTGLLKMRERQFQADEAQKDRDFLTAKQQRITDSYDVDPSVLPDGASTGVVRDAKRPTPTEKYNRGFHFEYDPALGRTVKVQD